MLMATRSRPRRGASRPRNTGLSDDNGVGLSALSDAAYAHRLTSPDKGEVPDIDNTDGGNYPRQRHNRGDRPTDDAYDDLLALVWPEVARQPPTRAPSLYQPHSPPAKARAPSQDQKDEWSKCDLRPAERSWPSAVWPRDRPRRATCCRQERHSQLAASVRERPWPGATARQKPPTQLEVFRIILFATAALTACIRIHHRDCHGASTSRHVPPVDVDREDVCLLVLAIDLLKLQLDAGDLAGAI
jgi:hypothetical protein